MTTAETLTELIQLSHAIGREDRQMAILGEGNTSAKLPEERFVIKASGSCLATLSAEDITVCRIAPLLALLDKQNLSDGDVEAALLAARHDGAGKKPSVEAMFHAWLLNLPGINFVGHCHSLPVNQILCSPRAREFAEHRLFPDEIVCCGGASVFVGYSDPGLPLAREIRTQTVRFLQERRVVPRLILLQNHGLIAAGLSKESVLACLQMAGKAAAIFLGAAALGGPTFLHPDHVRRIEQRPDEAYRQERLKIGGT